MSEQVEHRCVHDGWISPAVTSQNVTTGNRSVVLGFNWQTSLLNTWTNTHSRHLQHPTASRGRNGRRLKLVFFSETGVGAQTSEVIQKDLGLVVVNILTSGNERSEHF